MPEQRATLVSWRVPAEESADLVAQARGGGRDRARPSRARARARIGRLVERRERPRAPARRRCKVAACASTSTPRRPIPPISGAAVSHDDLVLEAPDGNRFAAFLATPEEPARVGVVILPGRPRALSLLRGARAPLRRTRLRGARVRLLRAHGGGREARRRLRVHAARAADDARRRPGRRAARASRISGEPVAAAIFTVGFCFGGRNSWLAAASGPRARRCDRLLRAPGTWHRRLTRPDAARGRDGLPDPRAPGRRRSRDPRRGLARVRRRRSTAAASTTRS